MAKMIEITCKCGCGRKRMVRESDVKRGWGLYFDKSCKAKHQEAKTGQYGKYLRKKDRAENNEKYGICRPLYPEELAWDFKD